MLGVLKNLKLTVEGTRRDLRVSSAPAQRSFLFWRRTQSVMVTRSGVGLAPTHCWVVSDSLSLTDERSAVDRSYQLWGVTPMVAEGLVLAISFAVSARSTIRAVPHGVGVGAAFWAAWPAAAVGFVVAVNEAAGRHSALRACTAHTLHRSPSVRSASAVASQTASCCKRIQLV